MGPEGGARTRTASPPRSWTPAQAPGGAPGTRPGLVIFHPELGRLERAVRSEEEQRGGGSCHSRWWRPACRGRGGPGAWWEEQPLTAGDCGGGTVERQSPGQLSRAHSWGWCIPAGSLAHHSHSHAHGLAHSHVCTQCLAMLSLTHVPTRTHTPLQVHTHTCTHTGAHHHLFTLTCTHVCAHAVTGVHAALPHTRECKPWHR